MRSLLTDFDDVSSEIHDIYTQRQKIVFFHFFPDLWGKKTFFSFFSHRFFPFFSWAGNTTLNLALIVYNHIIKITFI